jgi:UPF0755 protein
MDTNRRKYIYAGTLSAIIIICFGYYLFFAAPERSAVPEQFTVSLGATRADIFNNLKSYGFIKNETGFKITATLEGVADINPGAYKISGSMNTWQIAAAFKADPYMKWVVISEGLRKEEIADLLAKNLGWSQDEKENWINIYTASNPDYFEGVYFPDTYLIPSAESPVDTAARLQKKFEEEFAPYAADAVKQNIKWTTILKIASLIQREAAGKNDMPIVSGVIWNRLLQGMNLDIDSTVQYARGDTGKGWWAPIMPTDKKIDSPYNTYLYKGLPPHPIDNPGLATINATLNPAKTDCLYYLHDNSGTIHCAATYAEHQANIEKYMR